MIPKKKETGKQVTTSLTAAFLIQMLNNWAERNSH